jgi:predicted nuclease of predicted toxin-antitoxin system
MKPRLLANENFPAPSIRLLRGRGYDVTAVAEGGGSLADQDVLALAVGDKRWIVTFDRDYGELIFARGLAAPPAVILFRIRTYRPDGPGRVLADLLDSEAVFEGHFVLVEETGLRKRPLPEPRSVRG